MSTTQVAAQSSASEHTQPSSRRLISLDVFRGLLVAGMVLVTNAGSWSYVYWPLKHADWNGLTPTDMIFPSFLFLVGISMTFSFIKRRNQGETPAKTCIHIVQRSVLLIFIGLFLNCFDLFQLPDLRIPGVLQRIGLCYLLGGLLYLFISGCRPVRRMGMLITVVVLLPAVYWMLQTLMPVPGYGAGRLDPVGTLSAYLDRAVFTTKHLWHWGGPGQVWDPEGLLTTLPAMANLLLGILAGEWLRSPSLKANSASRKVVGMVVLGVALMLIAIALNPLIPINKKIWTPSFVLFSGGFSFLALALLHWLIDLKGWRKGLAPSLIFGSNAILGFALANILNPMIGLVKFHDSTGSLMTIPGVIFQAFATFLDPWSASLVYALLFTLLIGVILWAFYHKRIFIKL